jgi:hypothetical protein
MKIKFGIRGTIANRIKLSNEIARRYIYVNMKPNVTCTILQTISKFSILFNG